MKNPVSVIVRSERWILRTQRRIWALQILCWFAVTATILAAVIMLVRRRRQLTPSVPLTTPDPATDTDGVDKPAP